MGDVFCASDGVEFRVLLSWVCSCVGWGENPDIAMRPRIEMSGFAPRDIPTIFLLIRRMAPKGVSEANHPCFELAMDSGLRRSALQQRSWSMTVRSETTLA